MPIDACVPILQLSEQQNISVDVYHLVRCQRTSNFILDYFFSSLEAEIKNTFPHETYSQLKQKFMIDTLALLSRLAPGLNLVEEFNLRLKHQDIRLISPM